jgi:hypothetical protein
VDNIEMDLRRIVWGDMDWIILVPYRDKWRAPVKAVMNLRFNKALRNSLVAKRLAASQEGVV